MRRVLTLALVFSLYAAGQTAWARDFEIQGTLKQLDVQTGVITLKPDAVTENRSYSLSGKNLPVVDADGKPVKLEALKVGARLVLKIVDDQEVHAIRVDYPTLWGVIQKVDGQAATVVVKDEVREHAVRLGPKAKVFVDGKPATVGALKAAKPIRVIFATDGQTVLEVKAGTGVSGRDPGRRWIRHGGIIIDVDHARRTLKLVHQAAYHPMAIIEHPVAPDAPIRLFHKLRLVRDGTFDQLTKPLKVEFVLDEETGVIESVEADVPIFLRRKVVKLDATRGKLIYEESKMDKTFDLDKNVRVFLPQ